MKPRAKKLPADLRTIDLYSGKTPLEEQQQIDDAAEAPKTRGPWTHETAIQTAKTLIKENPTLEECVSVVRDGEKYVLVFTTDYAGKCGRESMLLITRGSFRSLAIAVNQMLKKEREEANAAKEGIEQEGHR